MTTAKAIAIAMTASVMRTLKTVSLKVNAFAVPVVRPLNGVIKINPTAAPSKAKSTDSITNEVIMLGREKPRMRRVAISRLRYATAAYMVFIDEKHEPMAITNATMV